jgi:hypothetical protein
MTQAGTTARSARLGGRWRVATVAGLVLSAAGIGVLWASGVVFPFYPPPGILILGADAVVVTLAPWPWVPAVGAALGLLIVVGFVVSSLVNGTGFANLSGQAGVGPLTGTIIQLVGAIAALVAGLVALPRRSGADQEVSA